MAELCLHSEVPDCAAEQRWPWGDRGSPAGDLFSCSIRNSEREGSASLETSELKGYNMKRTTLTMLEFLIEYKNYSLDDAKEACARYQDGTWIPWTVICDICDYNDYYNDSIFSPFQAQSRGHTWGWRFGQCPSDQIQPVPLDKRNLL